MALDHFVYMLIAGKPGAMFSMDNAAADDTRFVSPNYAGLWALAKVKFGITSGNDGESEQLTPQNKLLSSIKTAEKAVTAEMKRLKKTPSAARTESEKKIGTLMSM